MAGRDGFTAAAPPSGQQAFGWRAIHAGELRVFGGPRQRGGSTVAAGDHLLHFVEVTGADEPLMPYRRVTVLSRALEFPILQAGVGGHPAAGILARQLKHAEVERV